MDQAAKNIELGRRGENEARIFLEARGFELCAQNLRVGSDEADLVMRAPDGSTIVVVEVKTRSHPDAWPEERVDAAKQRSLIRLARTLARRGRIQCQLRIDVIAVTIATNGPVCIRWFENAVQVASMPATLTRSTCIDPTQSWSGDESSDQCHL